jgi:hypothetical protein
MPKLAVPIIRPHERNGHTATPHSRFAERLVAAVPVPGERNEDDGSQGSQVAGLFGSTHIVGKLATFLNRYVVLPETEILVVSCWVLASWMVDSWDRFPHLAISSPEKRCGKTLLMRLLELVTHRAYNMANVSPAAVYRLIKKEQPTLLVDEAQSLSRRGSEAAEVTREIFNASIDRNARIVRCGGKRMDEVFEFPIYGPKVIALIGQLDSILADRCLPVRLERKTADQAVERYRSRKVEADANDLHDEIETWANENTQQAADAYDSLSPFPIANDRLAELLLPLQAVLEVVERNLLPALEAYARRVDEAEDDKASPGVLLLGACRELFGSRRFMSTQELVNHLIEREEEPWRHWNRGESISAEAIARLLRPFEIRPDKFQQKVAGKVMTRRGYYSKDFLAAWDRYLPPSPQPPGYPATPTA